MILITWILCAKCVLMIDKLSIYLGVSMAHKQYQFPKLPKPKSQI